MSPLDQRALEVFDQVCDLTPAERAGRIAELCGGEPALAALVQRMLAEDAGGDPRTSLVPGEGAELIAAELFADAAIPERIGHYRVIREVGRGGMGVVYEVEQDEPRRRVAMKVIRDGLAGPEAGRRFRREAHMLGRLRHPGIVHIYEAGQAQIGPVLYPFIAMEFVDGVPIDRYAERKNLSTRDRLELMARVCDAVEHAHQAGVVHRDLKPGNVLVVEEAAATGPSRDGPAQVGQPKVLDFGVARLSSAEERAATLRTEAGNLIGTLSYMSPEQVGGEPGEVDRRSDIYALGVLLFQLLAGRTPYDLADRALPEAARIIRDEEPSRLGSISTSFRGDVETIVAKALDKDPARRYATAAELAGDIRRYLRDQPITARPPGTLYQLRKFARRNRGLVAGTLMTAMALVAGMIATTWLAIGQFRASERSRQVGEDALRAAYHASLSAADAALRERDIASADRNLQAAPPGLRGWEWHHLHARLDESLATAPIDATPGERQRFDNSRGRAQVWFSPDGVEVHAAIHFYSGHLRVQTWAVAGLNPRSSWVTSASYFTALGPGDVLVRAGDQAWLLDVANGARTPAASVVQVGLRVLGPADEFDDAAELIASRVPSSEFPECIAIAPQRRGLLYTSGGAVRFAQPGRAGDDLTLGEHPEGLGGAACSPDGRFVVTAGNDRRLQCFDLEHGGRLVWRVVDAHVDAPLAVAFSPDGTLVATGGQDCVLRVWDARTGEPCGSWIGHRDPIFAIAFSPSGRTIASVDEHVLKLWPVPDGTDPGVQWRNDWFVLGLDVSPDDSLLAAVGQRGNVTLWDIPSGVLVAELRVPPPEGQRWQGAEFTGDGRGLRLTDESGASTNLDLFTGVISGVPRASRPPADAPPESTIALLAAITGRAPAGRLEQVGLDPLQVLLVDELTAAVVDPVAGTARLLSGHTQRIRSFEAIPSEGRLITSSDDRTLRMWDVGTGAETITLRGHLDSVHRIDVTHDGRTIFSASDDYTVRRWDTMSHGEIAAARFDRERLVDQLAPTIERLLLETGDASAAADRIDRDSSLSPRARQIGRQLLFGTQLHR